MKKLFVLFAFLLFCLISRSQPALVSRLDSLARAYERDNFHGVVLVARGDTVIYTTAYGYADLERKIKLTPSTLFKTESTGKMYTAVAILQLVEKGKLGLAQTVKELLPGLSIKNADKITVHHLLNHTSGLQSPWDHPKFSFKKVYSRAEMEQVITELGLAFDEPGKEMYYSNAGYIILSWIVEKLSGQSFDDYLATQIFRPQQMTTIRHLNDTVMPASAAQPYRFLSSRKYVRSTTTVGPRASGAGGWIASAQDLYRFMLGFARNAYFSAATLDIMRTANHTQPADSSYRFYSYGLENISNTEIKGVTFFGHSGGGAGFSIHAIMEPVTRTIVIFCSNTYINPRDISANYLRVALNRPAEKIKIPNSIRVYDLVEQEGIDQFIQKEKTHFQTLGIKPNDWLFINLAELMQEAGDFTTMSGWLDLGVRYFPESGFIRLLQSDAFASLGEKEKADASMETARVIAEKNKDQRMLDEIARRKQAKKP